MGFHVDMFMEDRRSLTVDCISTTAKQGWYIHVYGGDVHKIGIRAGIQDKVVWCYMHAMNHPFVGVVGDMIRHYVHG
jgi:hypothetical protein